MVPLSQFRAHHTRPSEYCLVAKAWKLYMINVLGAQQTPDGLVDSSLESRRTAEMMLAGKNWKLLDDVGLVKWWPFRAPIQYRYDNPSWNDENVVGRIGPTLNEEMVRFSPVAPRWAHDLVDKISTDDFARRVGGKVVRRNHYSTANASYRGKIIGEAKRLTGTSLKLTREERMRILLHCAQNEMAREMAIDDVESFVKIVRAVII